jgi:TolB protein
MTRFWFVLLPLAFVSCAKKKIVKETPKPAVEINLLLPGEERHLANARQLTHSGRNVEAYFSFDNRWLVFQSNNSQNSCEQIFVLPLQGGEARRISPGKGRATRGFFVDPGPAENSRIVFSSTHDHSEGCPAEPSRANGLVWSIHNTTEIYIDSFQGGNLQRLTDNKFYDAEASVSPDGNEIVFTSNRDGDLELYRMDIDGSNVRRLTSSPGYDGGAFFSTDGKQIIFQTSYPTLKKAKESYQKLLKQGLYKPGDFELYVMDRDGKNKKRITDLKASSSSPYAFPGSKRIIFSSNLADPKGRYFDLFAVNSNGGFLEKISFNSGFDGHPMFSFDGKRIVWASNRGAKEKGDINIFIADWVE